MDNEPSPGSKPSTVIEGSTSRLHDEAMRHSRRAALAKLGGFAAFTLPAVSTLLISNKASAVSVVVGPHGICVGNHNSCP